MTTDLNPTEVEPQALSTPVAHQPTQPLPASQSPAARPRRKRGLFGRKNKASVDEIWARTQAAALPHSGEARPSAADRQNEYSRAESAPAESAAFQPTAAADHNDGGTRATVGQQTAVDQQPAMDQQSNTVAETVHHRSGWIRSAIPILVVNAVSMWGQASYGHDHLVPPGLHFPDSARWGIGLVGALAAEVVALYVSWHAHDALLRRDHLTAGRLRRASYMIAFVVATVNYTHFAVDGWRPVPLAVVMAMFTVLSPWLWGLHTRRLQHMQLQAAGVRADSAGAVFAPARIWWFPARSMMARRWSIDHGVTDPMKAWEGYRLYRANTKGGLFGRKPLPPTPRPTPASVLVPQRGADAKARSEAGGRPVTNDTAFEKRQNDADDHSIGTEAARSEDTKVLQSDSADTRVEAVMSSSRTSSDTLPIPRDGMDVNATERLETASR